MAIARYIVKDVDAAISFYTSSLGFTLKQRWGPPFAIVSKDGLDLWLSGTESFAARAMPDGRRPEPGGWNRIVIQVADLPATVARLKEAGIRFRNDIVTGTGGKQILLEDPSGNPIELFQPV
jgi:catechol 2,3-dioxygenase-like lactoylglutathione lyase family enzyme